MESLLHPSFPENDVVQYTHAERKGPLHAVCQRARLEVLTEYAPSSNRRQSIDYGPRGGPVRNERTAGDDSATDGSGAAAPVGPPIAVDLTSIVQLRVRLFDTGLEGGHRLF